MTLVLYVAHPLGASTPEGVKANIENAMRWLAWLRKTFPETVFIAPWIAAILAGADDHDHDQRRHGMRDDCATVERTDGIVLLGSRISEGMDEERLHGIREGCGFSGAFVVYDLTALWLHPNDIPFGFLACGLSGFDAWVTSYWTDRISRYPTKQEVRRALGLPRIERSEPST